MDHNTISDTDKVIDINIEKYLICIDLIIIIGQTQK